MAETQNRRSRVILAVLLVLASGVALAAAFYFADGMALIGDLAGTDPVASIRALFGGSGSETSPTVSTAATSAATLVLPQGMRRDFALRIWQEQVDSQVNIKHLIDGDVKTLKIEEASYMGVSGQVKVTVVFTDGTSGDGLIRFSKFGREWYFRDITGIRVGGAGGMAEDVSERRDPSSGGGLPAIGDVDVPTLNTILREQTESQAVFDDYLEGNVERVEIVGVARGPGTATIRAKMFEKQHVADARIVAIVKAMPAASGASRDTWFLARFEKLGETPRTK